MVVCESILDKQAGMKVFSSETSSAEVTPKKAVVDPAVKQSESKSLRDLPPAALRIGSANAVKDKPVLEQRRINDWLAKDQPAGKELQQSARKQGNVLGPLVASRHDDRGYHKSEPVNLITQSAGKKLGGLGDPSHIIRL
jgi:hypothetical protein